MSEYTEILHRHYNQQARSLVGSHFGGDTRIRQQLDEFSRVLALRMWAEFNMDEEECIAAVNEIYSSDSRPLDMSKSESKKIMSDKTLDPTAKIPKFFASLVRDDARHNRVHSRMFAEEFQNIVLMFALMDNNITVEEATYINKYFQFLTNYCDREGVVAAFNSFDATKRITQATDIAVKTKKAEEKKSQESKKSETAESKPTEPKPTEPKKAPDKKSDEIVPGKAMDDLKGLVGLENVKTEIEGIMNFARIQAMRRENGLSQAPMSYHLVFTGNPGTGKTTVARIVSRIYQEIGLLSKGHLIEVDRGGLVAGYVGQTATKTTEVLNSAMGGVLFIDEAYTLANSEDKGFGQEAIDTILKSMEDHRDDLCVIVAGYDELMENFINSNPGLRSRFTRYIHFDDYSPEQLLAIFMQNVKKNEYKLGRGVKPKLTAYFTELYENRDENFGNGRTIRTYFETVITNQANRLAQEKSVDKDALMTITTADL